MKLGLIGSNPSYIEEGMYASEKSLNINKVLASYLSDYKDVICVTMLNPGTETLFGYLAINEKLPLVALVPYMGFSDGWTKQQKELYEEIVHYTDIEVIVHSEGLTTEEKINNCKRDIVERCDVTIIIGSAEVTRQWRIFAGVMNYEIITIQE